MPQIGRFFIKQRAIQDYVKILDNFSRDENYQKLGSRIQKWSMQNNRNPKMVYHYQLKVLKGK